MKKYSGTTSFSFEVERYRNIFTDELLSLDQINQIESENGSDYIDSIFKYELISLNVEGSSFFSPGKYYGEPYDCYQDEHETEIISVTDQNNLDFELSLTKSERESLLETIENNVIEDSHYNHNYD